MAVLTFLFIRLASAEVLVHGWEETGNEIGGWTFFYTFKCLFGWYCEESHLPTPYRKGTCLHYAQESKMHILCYCDMAKVLGLIGYYYLIMLFTCVLSCSFQSRVVDILRCNNTNLNSEFGVTSGIVFW